MRGDAAAARSRGRARAGYGAAAAVAAIVAGVFAFVGDGVDVRDAVGLRRLVVDVGHTAVWVLLTVAFTIAAARGRWNPVSQVVAVTAGLLYAVFLFAVFLWP